MNLLDVMAVMELVKNRLGIHTVQPSASIASFFLIGLSILFQLVAICLQMLLLVLMEQLLDHICEQIYVRAPKVEFKSSFDCRCQSFLLLLLMVIDTGCRCTASHAFCAHNDRP